VVSLDAPAFDAVTAGWRIEDGTAIAGEDYEAAAGVVRFAPGEIKKTLTVAVLGDEVAEGDETFALGFDDVIGAEPAGGEATVTIRDDDAPAPEPAPEVDAEPTPPADAASPSPTPSDPAADGLAAVEAAVEVAVEVQVSAWWYQLDITVTNTAERAVTDWTVTLPDVTPPEQLWNAVVVDDAATGTTFASERSWAAALAPGQSIGFGMGGDPGRVDTMTLDAAALSSGAEVDGIFV